MENNNLKGKKLLFLGSSITYGYASGGISFADFIGEHTGADVIKEAVSGTTLTDDSEDSYYARLKRSEALNADILICQLSTNDAYKKKPLGSVSDGSGPFNTSTVAGAIESIISYAEARWNPQIVFYTSPRYDNSLYGEMVSILRNIADMRNIYIIDLWNDESFNGISAEERERYMADSIHPTRDGYLLWWTPRIEAELSRIAHHISL